MIPFIRKTLLYTASFLLLFLPGFGCSPSIKTTKGECSSNRPDWIYNRPASPTQFIGIGNARLGDDPAKAQEQARLNALQDIAQQIEVTITSDVRDTETHQQVDTAFRNSSAMQKNIHSFAQAALQDWEVHETWTDPSGSYWCKVVLDKEKYYGRVHKKINDAMALASDALAASNEGSFVDRVRELYKGVAALDDFLGNAMRATVGGREIILNNELPRRLQQLLSSLVIKPNATQVDLPAITSSMADTFGVRLYIDGRPDSSIAVIWNSSVKDFLPVDRGVREDGLRVISLKKFPASAGTGTITATINLGTMANDLLQRQFALPAGSFTVSRRSPKIYLSATSSFCRQLVQRLTSNSAVLLASGPDDADFTVTAECTPLGDTINDMGIFRAKATLDMRMIARDGSHLLDVTEEVGAADGESAERAGQNAEKVALDLAVKRVAGAF